MEKVAWGAMVGAITGLLASLVLLSFDIHKAEWFVAAGLALGVFVGLLMSGEEGQQRPSQSTTSGWTTEPLRGLSLFLRTNTAVVWGTGIGALVGTLIALALLPFGVGKIGWFLVVGTVLGVFVGLLMSGEDAHEQSYRASHRREKKARG